MLKPSVISDETPLKPGGSSAWARWKAKCGTAATSHTPSVTVTRRRSPSHAAARASAVMARNEAP